MIRTFSHLGAADNQRECIDMMLGSQEGVPKKVTVRKRDVAGDSACTRNRHQDKHGKRRGRRSGSLCPNPVIFQFQIVFVSPPIISVGDHPLFNQLRFHITLLN